MNDMQIALMVGVGMILFVVLFGVGLVMSCKTGKPTIASKIMDKLDDIQSFCPYDRNRMV